MHVSDWMATLASVAGVPAAALAHANASGPKPLDSHNMAELLFGGTCAADRAASPRTSLVYFYGDDDNGAYASGDYKIVMGIDHHWGLWNQQWCLAANYSMPNRTLAQQDGQCDNPPGDGPGGFEPAPCPSAAPCLFDVVNDIREEHDLSAAQPERLAALLKEYRAVGLTDCWRTNPDDGCQSWTTPEQNKALNAQQKYQWLAPIGHAPTDWVPPAAVGPEDDRGFAAEFMMREQQRHAP